MGNRLAGLGTDGRNILLSYTIPKLDLQIASIIIQTLEGFEVFLMGYAVHFLLAKTGGMWHSWGVGAPTLPCQIEL